MIKYIKSKLCRVINVNQIEDECLVNKVSHQFKKNYLYNTGIF